MKKTSLIVGLAAAMLALAGTTFVAIADDKPKTDTLTETVKGKAKQAEKDAKDTAKKVTDEATEKAKEKAKAEIKPLAIGDAAPAFVLKDTAGKEVSLAELTKNKDKIVVVQWFNPGCPFVVKHYGKKGNTFNDMYTKYKDKGVIFLGINSGAEGKQGAGLETNAAAVKDWKIEYPILLDETGVVGKSYNAKRTPEMFIIAKDGTMFRKPSIN
jgi:peroxiredoxin